MKRSQAAIALALTITVGIVSRKLPLGVFVWDKSLGDALYTVMIYFFAALARPAWGPRKLAPIAIATSFAIELFQLTGIPLRLPRLLQIALGTSFAWHDVACYVVGGVSIGVAHAALDAMRKKRE